MRKFSIALLCALCLCSFALAVDGQKASTTRSNGRPYYIMVNRLKNTVTVFGLDEEGYYTVPVRAMIASTGRPGHLTPKGTYSITGVKKTWCFMVDGSYGQYSSQFYGNFLFHSVCYSARSHSALITEEYNQLGTNVSRGCVRLQVADAKWIYDNCAAGTKVTVYEDEDPGPLGTPERLVNRITPELDDGWEPTDPHEDNPWRERFVQSVKLDRLGVTLTAGEQWKLNAAVEPEAALFPEMKWHSSNESIALVESDGTVIGVGEGYAEITAACGSVSATCGVTVKESLLPLYDLTPGAWYYSAVRYAYEQNIMSGTSFSAFLPDETVSHAAAVATLYHMDWKEPEPPEEPEPEPGPWYEPALEWLAKKTSILWQRPEPVEPEEPEEEPAPPPWYADALEWALERGVVASDGSFNPDEQMTRRDFVRLLYRAAKAEARANAPAASDGKTVNSDGAEEENLPALMNWAAALGLFDDQTERRPRENDILTRAELAAAIQRFDMGRRAA